MSSLRNHLTFANVMSSLGVFIALGGTSVAAVSLQRNSVGPAQLTRDAVTSSKVRDRSLLAVDFKRGQLPVGPRGADGGQGSPGPQGSPGSEGQPGPQGPQGLQGADGAAGATNAVVRTNEGSALGISGAGNRSVQCAEGEKAIAGGALYVSSSGQQAYSGGDSISGSGPVGSDNRPSVAGTTPTGWTASFSYTNGTGRKLVVYALCVGP